MLLWRVWGIGSKQYMIMISLLVRDTLYQQYTVTDTAIDHLWGLGYYEGAPCSVQWCQTQRRAWRPLLKTGQ